MVISHSYVSLPEGNQDFLIDWIRQKLMDQTGGGVRSTTEICPVPLSSNGASAEQGIAHAATLYQFFTFDPDTSPPK